MPTEFMSDLSEFELLSSLEINFHDFDQYFLIRVSDGDFIIFILLKNDEFRFVELFVWGLRLHIEF